MTKDAKTIAIGLVLTSVALAGLRLEGVIDISWWWVFSPVWVPLFVCGVIFIAFWVTD